MSKDVHRLNLAIPYYQRDLLRQMSKDADCSVTELIKRAIDSYIAAHKPGKIPVMESRVAFYVDSGQESSKEIESKSRIPLLET